MAFETEIDVLIKGPEGPEGPQGEPGAAGPTGPAGTSILYGEGAPSNSLTGSNGDFYIDTLNGLLFGPKVFNAWPDGVSLVGPAGRSLLNGTINPAGNVGNVGDFYINTVANTLFGPKATGGWPSGVSIVGPQGIQGIQGIQGVPGNTGTPDLNEVTNGETVIRRLDENTIAATLASGLCRFTYFTARKTETITSLRVYCGTGGGVPTVTRFGVYSVDGTTGDLTLIASTANDVNLLRTSATQYTKALQASWSKVAGTRYAVGILVVSSNSTPTVSGAGSGNSLQFVDAPRLASSITGQTDLPASVATGSMSNALFAPQMYLVP